MFAHRTKQRMTRRKRPLEVRQKATRIPRRRPPNRLSTYFIRHAQAARSSLWQLLTSPFASILTLAVLGIALALPALLYVFLQNAQGLQGSWNNSAQISLYLNANITNTQAQDLAHQLRATPTISQITYISPEEGLAQFQKASGLGDVLDGLAKNPLPGVILVQPAISSQSPMAIAQLVDHLKQMPQVDTAQLDTQWVKRLYALLNLARQIVLAIAIILGLGVVLIVGNTIRLLTQNRQREIEVQKLVGATHAFVKRPFLYLGLLYGFAGSLLAWFIVEIIVFWLSGPIERLSSLYGASFQLHGLSQLSNLGALLVGGALLGWVGAYVAVTGVLWRDTLART